MGQLVTTIGGAAVGFLICGPIGMSIGAMAGSMAGQYIFAPTIEGPRLNDLKVTASTHGSPIPEGYGTFRIGGNMIWSTGIQETSKTERVGKGGGPKQTTYTYDATFAMAICKGPIDDILRVWADGKLIYDNTDGRRATVEDFGQRLLETRNPFAALIGYMAVTGVFNSFSKTRARPFRLYKGTEAQLPDSLIEADKGVGNVSAHRGLAYVVFEKFALADYGNRIPQFTFEVSKSVGLSLPTIAAKNEDDTRHVNAESGDWVPFWDSNKIVSSGRHGTFVLDATTMKTLQGTTQRRFDRYERKLYVPGRQAIFYSDTLRNSAPVKQFSLTTFEDKTSWGQTSNNLSASVNLSGFIPVGSNRYNLGNLGVMGYYRFGAVSTGSTLLDIFISGDLPSPLAVINTTWRRDTWVHRGREYPEIIHPNTPFVPWFYFEGPPGRSTAQIVGYRGANNRIELLIWSISRSAEYSIFNRPEGREWKGSSDYSVSQVNIAPYPGETFSLKLCNVDSSDGSLFGIGVSNGVPCVFKYQLETGEWLFRVKHPGMPLPVGRMHYSRLKGGSFGYISRYSHTSPEKIIEIDLLSGELLRNVEYGRLWGPPAYAGGKAQWDDVSKSLIVETYREFRRIWFRSTGTSATVAAIVRDVCINSGVLTDDDIDVSDLEDRKVIGYYIDRPASAGTVIKQLATGHLFDGFESDYVLTFRKRGSNPIVNIPEEWMGRNEDGNAITETRTQELEMPMRVVVNYYDMERDHQQGTQTAKRLAGPIPSMWTAKEDIIDLPITWTPDDAIQCADRILKMQWANRDRYALDLPWRYLKYDPTDVVTATLDDGTTFTMRLTDTMIGADYTVKVSAVSEKRAAYTSNLTGISSDVPYPSIEPVFPSYPVILNTPLLRDMDYRAEGNAQCYVTADTDATVFSGSEIYIDTGYDYAPIASITKDAKAGTVINRLPATKAYESTDEETVLVVRLNDPDALLESVTQLDLYNSQANSAMVGDEIIQFREAEQVANGDWHLRGILRARRGTNYAVNNHSNGERFVFLDTGSIGLFSRPPSEYTITKEFRSVPLGGFIEDAEPVSATLTPRDLMPYTPEDIKITDDGTDVSITMSRRSRITAPLTDGTSQIHYKEGDKASARIAYSIWLDQGLANVESSATPDLSGDVQLFDQSGAEIDTVITFPLADLSGNTRFLLKLAEIGVVEGIPKFVEFERLGQNRWNTTDLY